MSIWWLHGINVFLMEYWIEDMIRAEVRYSRGAVLNYGLVAFSPWEGYEILYWYRGNSLPKILGAKCNQRWWKFAEKVAKCNIAPDTRKALKDQNPSSAGGHGGADPWCWSHFCYDGPQTHFSANPTIFLELGLQSLDLPSIGQCRRGRLFWSKI